MINVLLTRGMFQGFHWDTAKPHTVLRLLFMLKFHVGTRDTARSSTSLIKKDYRVIQIAAKNYGAHVDFAFHENHSMIIALYYCFAIICLFSPPQFKGVPDPCEQVLLYLCNVPIELRVPHENLDVSVYIYPCETRVCVAFYL